MKSALVLCAIILASSVITSSAVHARAFAWVHPEVTPVEVAFLETDVPALAGCVAKQEGNCGLERNDFSALDVSDRSAYFASSADSVEFTGTPDMIHAKFPLIERDGSATLAVLVYERTDKGLVRKTAALGSQS